MRTTTLLLLVLAASIGAARGQAGTETLAMPAILSPPAHPEAVAMWQRSANDPSVLFGYLDREALRKALASKGYDAKSENLLLELEYIAVERLGDTASPSLIPKMGAYLARKVAAEQHDAATVARLWPWSGSAYARRAGTPTSRR